VKRTSFALTLCGLLPLVATATENLPRIPFAESARLPEPSQFVVTPWYSYSVFRKLWIGDTKTSIEMKPQDDFELNDGMLRLDYGLSRRFALDLTFGYTSAATRAWNPQNEPQTTQGLMDTQIGLRYRLLDESEGERWYVPTLTLRLGGIIKGTYDADFPISPGDGASGVEASVMMTKTLSPSGFGVYGEVGYRLRDNHVPQTFFASAGLSETIRLDWVINSLSIYAGYRGLYDLNGPDLSGGRVTGTPYDYINLSYTRIAREIYHLGELGLAFTDRGGRRYFFSCAGPFDGRNTGKVNNFIIGLSWPLNPK
jgi:hypothetical protein